MVYGKKTDLGLTLAAIAKAGGKRPWRQDVLNEIVAGHTIDTCDTVDAGWETGIQPPKKPWVIVESYPSKKEAVSGHAKWATYVKGGGRHFPDNQP